LFAQGLLTPALRRTVEDEQQAVVALIDAKRWAEAHSRREVRHSAPDILSQGICYPFMCAALAKVHFRKECLAPELFREVPDMI
jgi:hypothetical protein